MLGGGGNGDLLFSVERWHVDGGAESGLGKTDGQPEDQVVVLSQQEGVGLDPDIAVEVAAWSAAAAGFAFSGESDGLAVLDTGWDFDG